MKNFTLKTGLPLLAALLVFGCNARGGSSDSVRYSENMSLQKAAAGFAYDDADVSFESIAEVPGSESMAQYRDRSNLFGTTGSESAPEAVPENVARKLVKRADIDLRVENLEEADASLGALMEKYGAYAANTEVSENYHHYFIRVPSISYDAFLDGATGLGKIRRRTESAEDVTLRYYDLEGRLETKRELLKTFQSYLGKARNIEEILSVEYRIAELQNEIEGTGKELRNLANRIDFATVSLNMSGPAASVPYRGPTLGERTKELFSGFGAFLSTVVVALAGIVIYGIPILLLVVFFFWLLFGRVGLLKKLWRAVMGKKND